MNYTKEHLYKLKPFVVTIELEKHNDMLSSAKRPGETFTWNSGNEQGTSPLSYFLSSIGLCQFVHYAEHSIIEKIHLESLSMKLDGIVSQNPREFTEINYSVFITSAETDATVILLAKKAADDCYVTNTVKKSCKVMGEVIHNGVKITELF